MESKTANDLEVFESKSSVEDYIALLKPRVMLSGSFHLTVWSLVGTCKYTSVYVCFIDFLYFVGSRSCGAINMWFDRDIDSLMERTKKRPIPVGKIDADNALGFGIMLSVISVLMLGLSLNYLAACLLAFSIFFYIFIYTIWLKRRTPQNIVIGGAAGAFPPVIGWVCSTGELNTFPLILFLLIFIWTPPHFWALALYKDIEYSKAKVPMLPVVSGQRNTKIQIFLYSLLLMIVSLLPYFLNYSGSFYFTTSWF